MKKEVKFFYSDNTDFSVELLEDVSFSFVYTEKRNKCHLYRMYRNGMKDIYFMKNLYKKIDTKKLKMVQYIADGEVVDCMEYGNFVKQYSLTDTANMKFETETKIYEFVDIVKDEE